jgi:Protein of unknown function (DUF2752)
MSVIPIAVTRAVRVDRLRDVAIAAALVAWLAYTRLYFVLHAMHIAAPVCPFYYFTGHPCPFCGGTRSFAYMWQGDVADSVRLYPLGPALFAGTILGAGGLLGGAAAGRTWVPRLSARQWYLLGIFVGVSLLLSWALKVFVLGN